MGEKRRRECEGEKIKERRRNTRICNVTKFLIQVAPVKGLYANNHFKLK